MEQELPRLLAPELALHWVSVGGFRPPSIVPERQSRPGSYILSLPPRIEIGQIARLLPSLDVAAISQASSPESNPSLPLPVTALAGHDPANKLIGQRTEWHAAPLAG